MWWYETRNQKFKDLKQSIKGCSVFIKQFYCIVWSVEKVQKGKTQKVVKRKMEQ